MTPSPENPLATQLDQVKIENEKGQIMARLGLRLALYFNEPNALQTRTRIGEALDYVMLRFSSHYNWRHDEEKGGFFSTKDWDIPNYKRLLSETLDPDDLFTVSFHSGDNENDAGHFVAAAYLQTNRHLPEVGHFSVSLPISPLISAEKGAFRKLFSELCNLIRPRHGYGGLGIIRNPNPYVSDRSDPYCLPLAIRFPGLEFDHPLSDGVDLREGIKGVNWLTAVCDDLLAPIGGTEAVKRKAKQDSLDYTDYPEGLIIQAGPAPQLGDLEQDAVPYFYMKAHTLLKDIRSNKLENIIAGEDYGVDSDVFSRAWLDRLDEDGAGREILKTGAFRF